jgi:ABC-2 type transport system ATP-binding protein
LRLDGVGKRYGFTLPWVVRAVSLEIQPGMLVRFEGRNGSGKSTLLRIIAGVSLPSRGAVTGRPTTGYVPERFPPALPFPARDYLSHVGRVHGLAGDDLTSRVDACLDQLGGRELAGVPLRTMSKGMCQKVAVAQALLPRSGLLVLDEAWTGLDAPAKAALDEAVAERIAAGGSVVYVDHEPGRLAHLDSERWRLQAAEATRVAGPALADDDVDQAGGDAVEVEVAAGPGAPADLVARLDAMPGVRSVRATGSRFVVRVEPSSTDDVLRQMLSTTDALHVLRVSQEPGPGASTGRGGS